MRPRLPLTCALAVLIGTSGAARAFDLTGTWEGRQTCRGFDGERFSFKVPSGGGDVSVLHITQVGSALALRLLNDHGDDIYRGLGIDALDRPEGGQVYIVKCGTDDDLSVLEGGFDEVGSGPVKTKPNGSGTFKLLSTFFNDAPETAFCRWSYKRVDTADPGVPSCP